MKLNPSGQNIIYFPIIYKGHAPLCNYLYKIINHLPIQKCKGKEGIYEENVKQKDEQLCSIMNLKTVPV